MAAYPGCLSDEPLSRHPLEGADGRLVPGPEISLVRFCFR
jgi:hypothetical protein